MTNSVDPDQTAPIGAVCFGPTLFTSILHSSVMPGNYLQKTTSADDIYRCIFSWRFKGKQRYITFGTHNNVVYIYGKILAFHANNTFSFIAE